MVPGSSLFFSHVVFPSLLLCGHSPLPWQAELANEGHASPEAPQTAPAKPSLIPQGTQLSFCYSATITLLIGHIIIGQGCSTSATD
jgi:hypothetical protein